MAWFPKQAHRFSDHLVTALCAASSKASLDYVLSRLLAAEIVAGPLLLLV